MEITGQGRVVTRGASDANRRRSIAERTQPVVTAPLGGSTAWERLDALERLHSAPKFDETAPGMPAVWQQWWIWAHR